MTVTLDWLGCATYRLSVNGFVIFLDTFMDRVSTAPEVGLTSDQVTEADYILVGHAHFDHLAGADVIAKNTGAKVIAIWALPAESLVEVMYSRLSMPFICCSITWVTAASTSATIETSAGIAAPESPNSAAASDNSFAPRANRATFAPSAHKARAVARPIPREPPVIRATRPFKTFSDISSTPLPTGRQSAAKTRPRLETDSTAKQ